jgi:hypothetical protein
MFQQIETRAWNSGALEGTDLENRELWETTSGDVVAQRCPTVGHLMPGTLLIGGPTPSRSTHGAADVYFGL